MRQIIIFKKSAPLSRRLGSGRFVGGRRGRPRRGGVRRAALRRSFLSRPFFDRRSLFWRFGSGWIDRRYQLQWDAVILPHARGKRHLLDRGESGMLTEIRAVDRYGNRVRCHVPHEGGEFSSSERLQKIL
jgi:hypothetical protein